MCVKKTLGVVISTYNNPKWLEKTLWGYLFQNRKADEIIIADDGSGPETRFLIEKYQPLLPIKHVWHEDKGFRKTVILNKALEIATADYLVFTDQDCVPRHDFLSVHDSNAEEGRFLSGGYFKLPMSVSKALQKEDIEFEQAFSLSWLRRQGMSFNFKCSKLVQNHSFAKLMNWITPAKATWNGMNSSGWRKDILSVNGFDERMQYGGEDREMGERLCNKGIRSKQIRYSAIVLHLDHGRPYVNEEAWKINDEIRKKTKMSHAIWTRYGIQKDV